ncbi:2'-5' RNA ligase family protein [Streptomyces sp. WMMC1477]|uniref:2'-5' RNA ligase family protein n=1 Tax=Streptomyces sp. WMMC1477 TaxID=3015155 RepID=UPI0022B66CD8|nr:2'-5' RNA ligase family protein [Streptomyces sp. WMMC1477]MCZ7430109.1 2'-5' RNA ligase family protein [Streptomyces sp. WMMC1477]
MTTTSPQPLTSLPARDAGRGIEDFFTRVETRHHAWPAGRADLHWHLLFDTDAVERRLVAPYREITHQPGLAAVPARWAHLTVLHGGPVDAYRDGEIEAITEHVRAAAAGLAPFDLVVDRPTVGRVALECPARPGAPARRLWELTAAADTEVTGGRFPLIPDGYAPHLTLAYGIAGDQRADRLAIKAALSDHPGEPVTLRADRLALVAQSHNRRHITWTPLATVPLGPGPAAR